MYLSRKVKERIGAGVAALAFLVLFGGAGLFCLWAIGATIFDGMRAKSWVAVPATVTHVDTGQVGYSYEWQGARHAGTRPGTFVVGGRAEVDDWEDRIGAMLSRAMGEEAPVTVYVNPGDPRESMLDREIRWKLLAIFLPFGVGFTAGGLVAGFLIGRAAFGWKETGGGVPLLKPRAREALTQWTVALVWNACTLPIALVAIPDLWASGEWFPIVLLLIFPFVGLLVLKSAVQSTAAVLREGSPFNARTAS